MSNPRSRMGNPEQEAKTMLKPDATVGEGANFGEKDGGDLVGE